MKRTTNPLIVALTLAVGAPLAFAPACASTQTPISQVDDAVLGARVASRLIADPTVRKYEIDVDTLDGVVTLRGVVDTEAKRSAAVNIAERTSGAQGVNNQIMLESEIDEAQRSDFMMRVSIGARLLADPDVPRHNIDVDVNEGVVALSGIVRDDAARQEAGDIAAAVSGVREVRNEIKVEDR